MDKKLRLSVLRIRKGVLYVKEIVSREFLCYAPFLYLAFARLTTREILKDISTCLNSRHERLYHGDSFSAGGVFFCLLHVKALVVR
jgi:hypothetical protein